MAVAKTSSWHQRPRDLMNCIGIACEESFFERSDNDATVSHQETSLRTNMRVGGGGKDGKSCIADKQAK